ncbi:condensation domain-containing protein [Streptomyces sp. M19]
MRVHRLSPVDHVVVLVVHHIVCDGWSLNVLLRDLCLLYETGREAAVPAPAATRGNSPRPRRTA